MKKEKKEKGETAHRSYDTDSDSDSSRKKHKVIPPPPPPEQKRYTFEPRHEKTNILVSDLVRHKPGCTALEDG